MIAADFYGVIGDKSYSARVQRLAPLIDALDEMDADFIEGLIQRFSVANNR
jgi:hypothetical protein